MLKYLLIVIVLFSSRLAAAQNMRILNAFKQGVIDGSGNCASIALIKAAIDRYGVGNVFSSLRDASGERYFVILHSGKELMLTYEEIERAARKAKFTESSDPTVRAIKLYADTCFAVMAKHLQVNQSLQADASKYDDFDKAIEDLNDGFFTPAIAEVLGLRITPIKSTVRVIRRKSAAVVYNVYHAAYASYGIYDEASDSDGVAPIAKFRFKRAGPKCGFAFCGPSGAFEVDYLRELVSN